MTMIWYSKPLNDTRRIKIGPSSFASKVELKLHYFIKSQTVIRKSLPEIESQIRLQSSQNIFKISRKKQLSRFAYCYVLSNMHTFVMLTLFKNGWWGVSRLRGKYTHFTMCTEVLLYMLQAVWMTI